jgi:hypothetical protein
MILIDDLDHREDIPPGIDQVGAFRNVDHGVAVHDNPALAENELVVDARHFARLPISIELMLLQVIDKASVGFSPPPLPSGIPAKIIS